MAKPTKPLRKRIVNIVLTCLLAVVALFVILAFYAKMTGKSVFSFSVLWVLTDSMEDTIQAESYILVRNVDASDVKENDVITFVSRDAALNGALNTHRVVGIDENGCFITQGDNQKRCPVPDPNHVSPEDVRSRYVCNLSVLTVLGRVYNTNAGFLLSTLMIVVCMVLWFYRSFLEKKQKKEDAEAGASREDEIARRIAEEVAKLEASDLLKDLKLPTGSVPQEKPDASAEAQAAPEPESAEAPKDPAEK